MVLRAVRQPSPAGVPSAARTALVALLSALLLLVPAVGLAHADTFDDIYRDYRKTQRIDPCKYTAKELRDAKGQLGSDSDQYAPEFPDALDEAIAASGDCKKASSGGSTGGSASSGGAASGTTTSAATPAAPVAPAATTTSAAPATTATTTAPAVPAAPTPGPAAVTQPAAAAQDGVIAARAETPTDPGPEAWTWAVLAAAIVAAAALGWALVNATGRVAWLIPLGHSMGEAGWRIGLRWAEFRDWLRFGSGR